MDTSPRTLLAVGAWVTFVMLAIYLPEWLGLPVWVPFVAAPIAAIVGLFTVGRRNMNPPDSN